MAGPDAGVAKVILPSALPASGLSGAFVNR